MMTAGCSARGSRRARWRRRRPGRPGRRPTASRCSSRSAQAATRAVEAHERADPAADRGRDERREQGDRQVDPGRVDRAAEDIHAHGVGAQQMSPARRLEEMGRIRLDRGEGAMTGASRPNERPRER